MKKILQLIFFLLLFSCNTTDYNVLDISKSQIIAEQSDIQEYKNHYNKLNGKFYTVGQNQYYLLEKNGYKIELKAIDIDNEKWFTETTYHLKIIQNSDILFEKEIENYEPVSLTKETKNCEVLLNDKYAYILYVNGNGEKNIKQNLTLNIFDFKKKSLVYEKTILQQNYGISNLSATLDLTSENLLIAYTDNSKQNNNSLTYSVFNLKDLTFSKSPKSIFLFDKWEKRNPFFMTYNNQIYLFNSTGDDYGFFSYKGKSGMAISTIGNSKEPINYVSFYDNGQIYNMDIMNGYFYYKLAVENQSKEIIKKLKLNELK